MPGSSLPSRNSKDAPPPGTVRRESTTLLGALSDKIPREASVHVTVGRTARRSTVSRAPPKPGTLKGGKSPPNMSKKKSIIKKAQAKDAALNPS